MVIEEYGRAPALREVPIPRLREPDDVLLRVRACGVCATDLKVMGGALDTGGLPRIAGHEVTGVVEAVGPGVRELRPGQRAVSATYLSCGTCGHCRAGRETLCERLSGRLGITVDGGFAEYLRIRASNLVPVPDGIPDEAAAVLPCGAGVPYHALVRRCRIGPADTLLILGCGGVGLQAVQLAKLCGARVAAADLDPDKLELARGCGADHLLNTTEPDFPEVLRALGELTVLFDTTGSGGLIRAGADALAKGALLVLVGYGQGKRLDLELEQVVRREYEIIGSNGVGAGDLRDLMGLAERGALRPVVETLPLDRLPEAFAALRENRVRGRMVVIP